MNLLASVSHKVWVRVFFDAQGQVVQQCHTLFFGSIGRAELTFKVIGHDLQYSVCGISQQPQKLIPRSCIRNVFGQNFIHA
jgi:hypothetical protein